MARAKIRFAYQTENLGAQDPATHRKLFLKGARSSRVLPSPFFASQELRQLGPDATRLAEEIRRLMHSYDMDGIQRLLVKIALPEAAGQTEKIS